MNRLLLCLLFIASFFLPVAEMPAAGASALKPLTPGSEVVANHTPYDTGDCSLCHEKDDAKDPGPVSKKGNALCFDCHEEMKAVLNRKFPHVAASDDCGSCHNPHNSRFPKLLLMDTAHLCLDCHEDLVATTLEAPVKHDPVTKGASCVSCHNPHASDKENLLVATQGPLCLECHSSDKVLDHTGRKLTNFKKLLAENPRQHGPVESGECTACHSPHGSEFFRLLKKEYPSDFYAPYDPKRYALCFDCHEESAFASPETDSLTRFRDGKRNLHYLHVNKEQLGRTCRACHEVHASKQEHQIRESVPYGASGWALKINFQATSTGGTCVKTCHSARSYNNSDVKE